MVKIDLKDKMILTSRMQREQEIFKYVNAYMGSAADKGKGYATKGAEFYTAQEAKDIIYASLVTGMSGGAYLEAFSFVKDKLAMSVGVTLVAHGIQTSQTGVMKDVPNAKEIIDTYVDYIEDRHGY